MAGLTKKHGCYYALFRLGRKTKWLRIGSMPYKEALKRLKELELEFDTTYGGREIRPILFKDFSGEYLAYSETNKSPGTYRRDQISIKALNSYFNGFYLMEIGNKDIELYKAKRLKQVRPRTVNIELLCLSSMLRKAIDWGYLKKLPIIKQLKLEKKPPRFLTLEEMARLMQSASPWLRYILLVLRNTGLRSGELLSLKWTDIDFDNNALLVHNSKGKSYHRVPINPELRDTLTFLKSNYVAPSGEIKPRNPNQMEYVFCNPDGKRVWSFKKSFANAVRKASLSGVSPHTLRHTVASYLIMSGTDIISVQEILGHKDIATTRIYSHVTDTHKAMALNRLAWERPALRVVSNDND